MLHYNINHLAALTLVACLMAPGVLAEPLPNALTHGGQLALAQRILTQTVEVRRRQPPPPHIIQPGDPAVLGRGWLAAPHRVVTASIMTAGWPSSDGDIIEVRVGDGPWVAAAVGLMDATAGFAVLDVEVPAEGLAPWAELLALGPGRQLFAVGGALPADVRVGLRAAGEQAWYWTLIAPPLAPGTPLFDGEGALVTLVGLAGPLALPTEAMEALKKRSLDWQPQ